MLPDTAQTIYTVLLARFIHFNTLCYLNKFRNEMTYQSDETKAFAFVDEDLAGLSILCEQLLEIFLCDVVGQVTDKQATPLCVRFLTGLQQHGQCCPELLLIHKNASFKSQFSVLHNTILSSPDDQNTKEYYRAR